MQFSALFRAKFRWIVFIEEICYNESSKIAHKELILLRTHKFGNYDVSVLALGTSEFGGTCPAEKGFEFMDAFVEMGGNFIDTARLYGDFATPKNGESEKVIGRWMEQRHNRDQIFLSTKGAHPVLGQMHIGRLSREEIRSDIAGSLEDLRTDYVDVYWLHRDDVTRPVGDIMETMQSLIEDGSAKMIGVSNWTPKRILEANAYAREHGLTEFTGNQPQFSLAQQMTVEDPTLTPMDAETYRMHLDTNMPCCCFSSQGKGFFTKFDVLGEGGLPDKAKRRFLYPNNIEVYERMKVVREQTGLTIGAIALAWLTCQPFPTFALCGASRLEQVLSLKDAANAVLTAEQRDYLRVIK